MLRRRPRFTRTHTLFPYAALFRAGSKGKVTQFTHANAATLAQFDPVKVERMQFVGANGATVWGMILKPEKAAAAKLPVAFLVHGGPQGSSGDSWSTRWNPRLYAAQGYRSAGHTSELQSLMRISYADF